MAKPSDHPDFKRLKKKWDERLAESGFVDQEDSKGNLKQTTAGIYARYSGKDPVVRMAKYQFFSRLGHFVAKAHFPTKFERFVLENYSEGLTQVEIKAKLLEKGIKVHRVTIYRTIKKWLKKWNLK